MPLADLIGPHASWKGRSLLASSIPHLLHQDLCLYWVLKRPADLRPDEWLPTINLWRRLVALLLLGDLRPQAQQIVQPLSQFTNAQELGQIVRYFPARGVDPVGVASFALLIRPLPDANPAELLKQLPDPAQDDRLDVLSGLAKRLCDDLAGSPAPYFAELRTIIEEDIVARLGLANRPRRTVATSSTSVQLWTQIDDTLWTGPRTSRLEVMTFAAHGAPQYVPRCQKCNAPLLQKASDAITVAPETTVVSVTCACGEASPLELSALLVSNVGELPIAWLDRAPVVPEAHRPPPAKVQNLDVTFEWDPIMTSDRQRRFLTLRFPLRPVRGLQMKEICFERFLDLKLGANVIPIPVRPDWQHLVTGPPPTLEQSGTGVRFKGLLLSGMPVPIDWPYLPTDVQSNAGAALVLYPARMPNWWRRYRVAATGTGGGAFRVTVGRTTPLGSQVEVADGWPASVSIQSGDGRTGCSYRLTEVKANQEGRGATECRVAVDFGTSSTVVSVSFGDDAAFVEPGDLKKSLFVAAGAPAPAPSFLPGPDPIRGEDAALFPSAIWDSGDEGRSQIRFGDEPPSAAHKAFHGFKWERDNPNQSRTLRRRYLEELLFLVLPSALLRHGATQAPNLKLGFAFPLAFDSEQRRSYQEDLETIRKTVREWWKPESGFATLGSVNESTAAVTAFGGQNPGDTYLLADLGGGSLDLALFTKSSGNDSFAYHHLGSYHFGGELLLLQIVQRLSPQQPPDEAVYWQTRNAILQGRVADQLKGHFRTLSSAADTFLPMALEIVRVSAEAFRHAQPETRVNVLLIGNGWRAAQFAPDRVRGLNESITVLAEKCRNFENPSLNFFPGGKIAPKLYVGEGVMRLLRHDLKNELHEEGKDGTRLPAGVGFTMHYAGAKEPFPVHWYQLLGADGEQVNIAERKSTDVTIKFDTNDIAVPPDRWAPALQAAWKAAGLQEPYPSDAEWLQLLQREFDGARLLRGPFQITVQEHWRRALEGR